MHPLPHRLHLYNLIDDFYFFFHSFITQINCPTENHLSFHMTPYPPRRFAIHIVPHRPSLSLQVNLLNHPNSPTPIFHQNWPNLQFAHTNFHYFTILIPDYIVPITPHFAALNLLIKWSLGSDLQPNFTFPVRIVSNCY